MLRRVVHVIVTVLYKVTDRECVRTIVPSSDDDSLSADCSSDVFIHVITAVRLVNYQLQKNSLKAALLSPIS
jgi:hypothetical protein